MLRKVSERESVWRVDGGCVQSVGGRGGVFAEWKGECKHYIPQHYVVLFTQPAGNELLATFNLVIY